MTQNRGTDGSLVSRPSQGLMIRAQTPVEKKSNLSFFPKAYLLLLCIVVTIQAVRLLPRHFLLFPVCHMYARCICLPYVLFDMII